MDFTQNILTYVQLGTSILLIIVVLLQQKGTGLSGVFGGSDNVYRSKRGIEKTLHILTIIFVILFFGSSLISVII